MKNDQRVVVSLLIVGVIVGVASYFLLSFLMAGFFAGDPGVQAEKILAPYMATGIAVTVFTISMLFYPVYKKGDKTHKWEDYR
ncbi:hypothetical protein OXIME_000999 [Oxyplasma meridianum]|uniref:Uncharacterized protein n=1 Tax=Oxyplasma meridianum TaxID=3073602 RepID=A0AAX4NG76_9ARCH